MLTAGRHQPHANARMETTSEREAEYTKHTRDSRKTTLHILRVLIPMLKTGKKHLNIHIQFSDVLITADETDYSKLPSGKIKGRRTQKNDFRLLRENSMIAVQNDDIQW